MTEAPLRQSSDAMHEIARRLVWWKPAEQALANTPEFLAQVMTLGTWHDVQQVIAEMGEQPLRATLAVAPPGIFDARSWHYWHLRFGISPIPRLPRRKLT